MSTSRRKFPVPEVVVFVIWVGVSIVILVKGYHHPAIAFACWIGFMYVLSGISREIRAVRRITEKYRD